MPSINARPASVTAIAVSVLLLSAAEILLAYLIFAGLRNDPYIPVDDQMAPYALSVVFIFLFLLAAAGIAGFAAALGLLRMRNWGRLTTLVIAGLILCTSLFGLFVSILLMFGSAAIPGESGFAFGTGAILLSLCVLIFAFGLWWIILLNRKNIREQFSPQETNQNHSAADKSRCPPPIALLAWLMVASSILCLISWPLLFGKIPAMLFTHIYLHPASSWIWAINSIFFIACGIGLLKLQRWSYTATIAIHAFWMISLLVSQLSPLYSNYTSECLDALQLTEIIGTSSLSFIPAWLSATLTALPTALLIAGLFYYRPSFLAASLARHQAQ